jgi:hypothetical protein
LIEILSCRAFCKFETSAVSQGQKYNDILTGWKQSTHRATALRILRCRPHHRTQLRKLPSGRLTAVPDAEIPAIASPCSLKIAATLSAAGQSKSKAKISLY